MEQAAPSEPVMSFHSVRPERGAARLDAVMGQVARGRKGIAHWPAPHRQITRCARDSRESRLMLTRTQQAEFRPLVTAAWAAQCQLTGRPVTDKLAKDAWYRDQLLSVCGIQSTRTAGERDFEALIAWFRVIAGAVIAEPCVTVTGFSDAQNTQLRALAGKAYRAASQRPGGTGLSIGPWFDRELQACGIAHRAAPNRVKAFDVVMSHLAVIAGDMYWIDRTSHASEARMRWQIARLMEQLSALTEQRVDWEYCRAIYRHMNLPLTMEEAAAQWLWKVLQALDTHVRRLTR
jgi:hypothetical protein